MHHLVRTEYVTFSRCRVCVDVPQPSNTRKDACVIDNDLHTTRLHHPQIQNPNLAAILFPDKLSPDVHICVSIMVSIHLDRIPKYCRRHERIRSDLQKARDIGFLRFYDALLRRLVEFNRHLCQRFRQHLETCEIRHLCHRVSVLISQESEEIQRTDSESFIRFRLCCIHHHICFEWIHRLSPSFCLYFSFIASQSFTSSFASGLYSSFIAGIHASMIASIGSILSSLISLSILISP